MASVINLFEERRKKSVVCMLAIDDYMVLAKNRELSVPESLVDLKTTIDARKGKTRNRLTNVNRSTEEDVADLRWNINFLSEYIKDLEATHKTFATYPSDFFFFICLLLL